MSGGALVAALRMLAARRLTEAELWARLERKDFSHETIADAVARCKRDGYVDDELFARLYVEGKRRALGDARLVAELVKRGIDREAARESVARSSNSQDTRIDRALEKLFRTKPALQYPTAARALERLGFPAPLIYRTLRRHASEYGPFAALVVEAEAGATGD